MGVRRRKCVMKILPVVSPTSRSSLYSKLPKEKCLSEAQIARKEAKIGFGLGALSLSVVGGTEFAIKKLSNKVATKKALSSGLEIGAAAAFLAIILSEIVFTQGRIARMKSDNVA